jgi:hypothetical protein
LSRRSFRQSALRLSFLAQRLQMCKKSTYKETDMKRLWFWFQKKRRMERRDCGGCCLLCKYYRQCSNDGEF